MLGPAQCGERRLPLAQDRAGAGARALEPEVHVGDQPQLEVHALRAGRRLVVAGAGVGPLGGEPPVVEDRFAVEVDLGPALHAGGPQQDVVGVVVGRRAPVGARALLVVVPGPDAERVADDHPARPGPPPRLEHQGAGQVAPAPGRYAGGAESEAAGVAVEHGREHARSVGARKAHPLEVPARGDQHSSHSRRGTRSRRSAGTGSRGFRWVSRSPRQGYCASPERDVRAGPGAGGASRRIGSRGG